MSPLFLAARLVRGAGHAGLVRLTVLVVGTALGVAVMMFVVALPTVLNQRADTSSARLPTIGTEVDDGSARFRFVIVEDSWEGERFTRVILARTHASAGPPPGVDHFPDPGEVIASPRAAELIADHRELAERVPGEPHGTILPSGLLDPDELYAYVGVAAGDLPNGTEATGFGIDYPDDMVREMFEGIAEELSVLVLAPAMVYLLVCGRFATETRARRYAALRLMGMTRTRTLATAALESGMAAGLGSAVGVAAYHVLNDIVASSGVLGFTWYSETAELDGVAMAGVGIAVVALSGAVGALGVRGSLSRPLTNRSVEKVPTTRWWTLLPLVSGLGLTLPAIVLTTRAPENTRLVFEERMTVLVLTGIALTGVGALLAVRPVVAAVARVLTRPAMPLAVRLAGKRLEYAPAAAPRLAAGLAVLVITAGLSAGVLRDDELGAKPPATSFAVSVDGRRMTDPAALAEIARLPVEHRWVVQYSAESVAMITAPCDEIRMLTRSSLTRCQDGREFRVVDAAVGRDLSRFPAGAKLSFTTASGERTSYRTPPDVLVVEGLRASPLGVGSGILVADRQPTFGWARELTITSVIEPPESNIERFKSAVFALAPTALVDTHQRNTYSWEEYRANRGTVDFGVLVGFVLLMGAFLIAVVDRAMEERRGTARLVTLGTPLRLIRTSQVVQVFVPLLGVFVVALLAGHVAGNAWLQLNGRHQGWYSGTVIRMVPFVVTALVAATIAAAVTGGRIRASELHRE